MDFICPDIRGTDRLQASIYPYDIDITEISGFDDLHHPKGVLQEAEARAAEVYHAEETHYLVNGSTVGILSAVLGCTRPGERVLMSRNCHKSVYNALYINNLRPVYLYPEIISEVGVKRTCINGRSGAAFKSEYRCQSCNHHLAYL